MRSTVRSLTKHSFYYLNMLKTIKATSEKQIQLTITLAKRSWSTASKAADKSNERTTAFDLASKIDKISLCTCNFTRAVSQL